MVRMDVGKIDIGIVYYYNATVRNVVDGDTVDMMVDKGFRSWQLDRFRLWGMDTPELRSSNPKEREHAKKAKKRVEDLILNKEVMIRSHKAPDKYGRWLTEIFFKVGDQWESLKDILIREGLAREYHGGKRKPWNL